MEGVGKGSKPVGCGPTNRGFKSHRSPQLKEDKMRCLNCHKYTNSGFLFFRKGAKFIEERGGIDPETYECISIDRKEILRIFIFCSKDCERGFFLDKRWFNKSELSLHRRLISRDEVLAEFQAVLLSDKEEQKDLIYILGQSIWR